MRSMAQAFKRFFGIRSGPTNRDILGATVDDIQFTARSIEKTVESNRHLLKQLAKKMNGAVIVERKNTRSAAARKKRVRQ